jgi:putative copper resistance protein D
MPASLLVVVRAVQIGASLLLAGIFTFEFVALRPASRRAGNDWYQLDWRLFRLAFWNLGAALLSALLWFAFEVSNMTGLSLAEALAGSGWRTVLFATRFGRVWQLRLALIAACLALMTLRSLRGRRQTSLKFALWLLGASFLVSLAWISHPAAAPEQPLGLLADALHLSAAGAWMGGLPCLAIYLATKPGVEAVQVLRRFSALSLCCVSVLIISGIWNACLVVGSLNALFTTGYGVLLFVKLTLFAFLLGLGARNRLRIRTEFGLTETPPDLFEEVRRDVVREICLGVAVVAVVGWLGATPPPRPESAGGGVPGLDERREVMSELGRPWNAEIASSTPGRFNAREQGCSAGLRSCS